MLRGPIIRKYKAAATKARKRALRAARESLPPTAIVVVDSVLPVLAPSAKLPDAGAVYNHLFGRLSSLTRKAYERDLLDLAEFLGLSTAVEAVGQFLSLQAPQAHSVALGWLEFMRKPREGLPEGLAPATQKRHISALSSVVTIARALGVVTWELKINVPKAPRTKTRGYSPEIVHKLLQVCGTDLVGARDRVVLRLLVRGLRRVEIARLRVRDYDGEKRLLFIRGKGYERDARKADWFTVSEAVCGAVEGWLKLSGQIDADPEEALLFGWKNNKRAQSKKCSTSAGGLTPYSVRIILDSLVKKADLRDSEGNLLKLKPHKFRNTGANALIKDKAQLVDVQKFLRHEDPRTTMIYFDDNEDVGGRAAEQLEKIIDEEGK